MKLFTVGPVEMYEETLILGKKQVPYFRNETFSNIMIELDQNLKKLLNMSENDKNIILTASGTGAMEATVLNCFNENDKVLIISGGSFGERFEQICQIHGVNYDVLKLDKFEAFNKNMLNSFNSQNYTALLVNIHETSTGQLYPIELLSEFCFENNMYFVVDAISSLFADKIDFTKNKIDALIFSSHKALALPPGISVVSISENMQKKINSKRRSFYFDFNEYLKNGIRGQTPFTPAISIIIQMNEMIKHILHIGIEKKISNTKKLAENFRYELLEHGFEIPKYQLSNSMTPICFGSGALFYYNSLIENYQITVNPCSNELKDKMLRVGHMGNISMQDISILVKALCEIRGRLK